MTGYDHNQFMSSIVEYCISSCESDELRDADAEDVDFRDRRCLEHCGICRDRPFAVVDGDLVSGAAFRVALTDLTSAPDDNAETEGSR